MGGINMGKMFCFRKYFLFGSLIFLMLFMLGCSNSGEGGDPYANGYDETEDAGSGGSLFDDAVGAGGAAGGIGAGIALSEMAFPPGNANANPQSATEIDLNWDAATGNNIDGYNIYREGAFVKSVSGTSTTDEGLEPGTRYCYQIAAYNDLMESLRIDTCAKTYFTRRWGTESADSGSEVAVDAKGNIYVVGYTEGDMYKKPVSKNNVFLTKFNAAGIEQWTRQLNTNSATTKFYNPNMGVAVDAVGNIYITGNTSLNLNPLKGDVVILIEGYDAFLAKFDTNGNTLWTRMLSSSGADYGTDVAVDIYGNVYISGYTDGNLDGNIVKKVGYDMFVAMYDSAGNKRWVNQLDIKNDDYGWGIAVDSIGHIYVSGTTGSEDAGQVRTKGSSSTDMFLASYNNAGLLEWVRSLGSKDISINGCRVAVGADGIYVTGSTTGNLDGNHSSTGYDMFLVKYSYAGFMQWLRQLGDSSTDLGSNIAADAEGYIYVTGTTYSDPFDGMTNAGNYDMFLTKYDAAGNRQWTQLLGGLDEEGGTGVTIGADGYIYVTGYSGSSVLDGNSSFMADDAFLAKYNSDGVRQ
jgi:hypothetical protein